MYVRPESGDPPPATGLVARCQEDAASFEATTGGLGRDDNEGEPMGFTAPERETVINISDDSEVASVYSAQRRRITQLKKNPAARLVEEGTSGGSPWARFEIDSDFVSFRSKRRVFSPTERSRRAAQLRTARETLVKRENDDSNREF